MSLKIVNKTAFLRATRRAAIDAIKPAVDKALPKIAEKAKRRVLVYFRRHPIIQGISGKYPNNEDKDIQAIFGLTDSLSEDAIQEILSVVENSITITYRREGVKYKFFIKTDNDMLNDIIKIPSATYDYEVTLVNFHGAKRKYTQEERSIPWLFWLLNGANAEADLTFDLDGDQAARSRSGRAVMERPGVGDWVWEGQSDFITEIGTNPKLIEEISQIFKDELQRQIDKL
jgi:hypothetical protein